MRAITYANDAHYDPTDQGAILGDPTEGALLVLAHKAHADDRREEDRVGILPFDSDRKLMSAYTADHLYTKGSPDTLIDRSTRILTREGVRDMTSADIDALKEQNLSFAKSAYRVLAVAYREKAADVVPVEDVDEQDMIFIGLVAIIDPPREEVRAAVETAYEA